MTTATNPKRRMVWLPAELVEEAAQRWPELLEHPEVRALAPRRTAEGAVRAILFVALRRPLGFLAPAAAKVGAK